MALGQSGTRDQELQRYQDWRVTDPPASLPEEGASARLGGLPPAPPAAALPGRWGAGPPPPGTGGHTPAPWGPGLPGVLHSETPPAIDFLVGPVVLWPSAFYQNGLVSGHSDPGAGTRGVAGTLPPKMGFVFVLSGTGALPCHPGLVGPAPPRLRTPRKLLQLGWSCPCGCPAGLGRACVAARQGSCRHRPARGTAGSQQRCLTAQRCLSTGFCFHPWGSRRWRSRALQAPLSPWGGRWHQLPNSPASSPRSPCPSAVSWEPLA